MRDAPLRAVPRPGRAEVHRLRPKRPVYVTYQVTDNDTGTVIAVTRDPSRYEGKSRFTVAARG